MQVEKNIFCYLFSLVCVHSPGQKFCLHQACFLNKKMNNYHFQIKKENVCFPLSFKLRSIRWTGFGTPFFGQMIQVPFYRDT